MWQKIGAEDIEQLKVSTGWVVSGGGWMQTHANVFS